MVKNSIILFVFPNKILISELLLVHAKRRKYQTWIQREALHQKAHSELFIFIYLLFQNKRKTQPYLIDLGGTFDIESLSISLTTNSFLRKDNVPLDTLTGIRMKSATSVIGAKTLKLKIRDKNQSDCNNTEQRRKHESQSKEI